MSDPIREIINVDRVVHEPSRLAILATLHACKSADVKHLQSVTGLSRTNLWMQLLKLEAHGLIAIEKTFVAKTPRTGVQLTSAGKTALRNYRRLLQNLLG